VAGCCTCSILCFFEANKLGTRSIVVIPYLRRKNEKLRCILSLRFHLLLRTVQPLLSVPYQRECLATWGQYKSVWRGSHVLHTSYGTAKAPTRQARPYLELPQVPDSSLAVDNAVSGLLSPPIDEYVGRHPGRSIESLVAKESERNPEQSSEDYDVHLDPNPSQSCIERDSNLQLTL